MKDNGNYKGHAIALFSGGLDSALAILLILRQNIKVTALNFMTHFGCDITDKSSCSSDPFPAAEKFGFTVKLVHLGHEFVDIVKNPKHGHGKNMNPCIDCRILMLKKAKDLMGIIGADFIITGEVVGQRPMSQHKPQMRLIEKESDLMGKLVRPLSARILPPTEPELKGILDREQLEDISGRSRARQMALAEEYGLEDYPTPAAGCLLTDPNYSNRLRDLIRHQPDLDFNDLNLLRIGRQFRINETTKLVVGRNEVENNKIAKYARPGDYLFEARETGSPITLLRGKADGNTITTAAAITARYCDKKRNDQVCVTYFEKNNNASEEISLEVVPQDDATLEKTRL